MKPTIFAKTLERNRTSFPSPPPIQCWFLVRLCSALGHNQAAEWLSFKSGNHISDQHCSGGQEARKKAFTKVSSDIFCMVNQTKKQQNEVFLQVVLARIV